MGIRGTRPNDGCIIIEEKPKRKIDNTKHSELCKLAGKWLFRGGRLDKLHCSTVVIEPSSMNVDEMPDVFGWNYWTTAIIEVKVSRSDFLADVKKPFRKNPAEGCGEHRFYCCPDGLIKETEIPKAWGLLYEKNGKIEVIRHAESQICNSRNEFHLLASIVRKYGFEPKIYQFTKRNL